MIFSGIKAITIPEGVVKQISCGGDILWKRAEEEQGLPSTYQEVEYIESTGTQWIDTGLEIRYVGALTTDWSMKFAITDLTRTSMLGGAKDTFDKQIPFINGDNKIRANDWCVRYSRLFFTEVIVQDQVYVLAQEGGKYKFGSDSYDVNSNALMDSDAHFGLFAKITGSNTVESGTIAHMRLYDFTVKINQEVTHRYIPCYRKADGAAGLYDVVGETFITNSGSGTFVLGPEVYDISADYQQVQYITGSTTSAMKIDTGIVGHNQDLKIEIDYMHQTVPASGVYQNIIASTYVDEITNTTRILQYGPNTTYVNHSARTNRSTTKSLTRQTSTRYKEELTYTNYKVNGSDLAIIDHATGHSNTSNLFIHISSKIYMYIVRLYDGSTMVREFIPCYRKSDSIVGMYDTVSKTFFTTTGTDPYVAGPDVLSA